MKLTSYFKDFMNLYNKRTAKPYSYLAIDATLASGNPLCLRKNLSERTQKLIMTTDDKISDKKLQYDINKKAAKKSVLSSQKIDKYEYLTGEEMFLSIQRQINNRTSYVYIFTINKAFWKPNENNWRAKRKINKNNWRSTRKTNKDTWKQSQKIFLDNDKKLLASLFPKDFLHEEVTYEL